MGLTTLSRPRLFDDPKFQQRVYLGFNGRLFLRGMVTLWGSVARQLPFSSIYLDHHRLHSCREWPHRCAEDIYELSAQGPQCPLQRWRSLELNHGK